jgi:Ca2+-binding RTX toxin-like protein
MNMINRYAILVLAILGSVESALASAPMCNGRVATHWVNLSTIRHYANSDPREPDADLIASHGDDVVVIDLSGANLGTDDQPFVLEIDLRQSSYDYDMVCVAENPGLRVEIYGGGEYVKTDQIHSIYLLTYQESHTVRSLQKEVDVSVTHGTRIETGDYDDVVLVHSVTSAKSNIIVETRAGNDRIVVDGESTDGGRVAAAINSGPGDDTVEFHPNGTQDRAFIHAHNGKDSIKTSNGDDVIFSSYMLMMLGRTGNFVIEVEYDLAMLFLAEGARAVLDFVDVDFNSDSDGDTVDAGGGDDYVFGSFGTDYIRAGGGHDYVQANGGRDRIWGGSGNDELYGGDGNDDVYGENGHDFMDGGFGNDLMKGGKGEDEVRGGDGDDELYGNENNDVLRGGNGKDSLYGGAGNDYLRGDNQSDMLDGEGDTNNCYGGNGDDVLKHCLD